MKKILLIDGSSLIFRAFYAIRNLTTREGVPTGAVYGFINMFHAALDRVQADYVLVAFDKAGPTLRTKDFADYKGHRDKTPDELNAQFGMVKDLLDSYGVKHLALDDYEADDIVGTLSKLSNERGIHSYMLTGDRDYFQLVDDMSTVLYTVKGISNLEEYDVAKIKEKYDLEPEKLIEVKGLMGDPSDNIPGVPGVGEKTAIKLVKEYGNIEGVYENIDKISGKALKQNLVDNEELAYMSRKLGQIITNVDLDFDIEDLAVVEPNAAELYEKYKALDFNSLTERFAPQTDQAFSFEGELVDHAEYDIVFEYIRKNKKLIFDIACEGDYLQEKARFIAIKGDQSQVLIVDLESVDRDFLSEIKTIIEDKEIEKIAFDIKKMSVLLNRLDIDLEDNYQDLMIISYLINPKGDYSLKDIAMTELARDIKSLEEYLGKGKTKKSLAELDKEDLKEFLSNNLFVIDQALEKLLTKLEDLNMTHLLENIELPLIKVLTQMEITGIRAEKEIFEKIDLELTAKLEEITSKIYSLAGEEFNINSPKQLGEILFDKLKLPVIKKTKTGYSTNIEVLEKLKNEHEIIPLVEEYRMLSKIKSTYIDGLIKEIRADGRIHAKFNQTVAATGRLSSNEPNLQNIPIKTEEGRAIRKGFLASEDKVLISADYSQIELRVLAALTNDENMLDAFEKGIDIHTKTASEVFNVDLDEVTKLQRSEAKAVNFGIVYGISDYGLSQDLNITRKQAKTYIDEYLNSYPQISKYMEDVVKKAKTDGYVETIFERRRYIPEINSSNFNLRSFGERIALNTPIQGTAADIIKLAMINVYDRLKEEGLDAKLILQIHDELVIEAPKSEKKIVEKLLKEEMENAVDLKVKLLVELESGDSWYEV